MKESIPKGLFDILPYGYPLKWQSMNYWLYLEEVIRSVAYGYGFQEIRTPVFEKAEVFFKGVGATSDIVSKEMYLFEDRKKRLLALRPEGTSSVLRAFVEKNLAPLKKIHKLFYIAPMFRYERPQAGRYRQHHQFGVEVLGTFEVEQDAEIIDMMVQFYTRLQLRDIQVNLNSVGDLPSKQAYKQALQDFLRPHLTSLSAQSKIRFEKNPLRILDSKEEEDKHLLKKAPSFLDFLNYPSKSRFNTLLSLLDALGIAYTVNPKIVRGLDYYNHTVFEVTSKELGAQNALGGGGRYDGFTASFGGESLPGIGFGTGLERVLQALLVQEDLLPKQKPPCSLFFVPLGEKAKGQALCLAAQLRRKKISCSLDFSFQKLKQALSYASSQKIPYVAILGEKELSQKTVQLKDMLQNQEKELSQLDFLTFFSRDSS